MQLIRDKIGVVQETSHSTVNEFLIHMWQGLISCLWYLGIDVRLDYYLLYLDVIKWQFNSYSIFGENISSSLNVDNSENFVI